MSKRFQEINFPEYKREVQLPLFSLAVKGEEFNYPFPPYKRGHNGIQEILDSPEPLIGIDLEFNSETKRCSILGLALRDKCASASFDLSQAREIVQGAKKGKYKLVGFSICGAEKDILEENLGEELPLDIFEDTMILFHLGYSHLTKSSGGKEGYEKGTLGFINLYTCASICTRLPNWKLCREGGCNGPCPRCDVWGYNAIDAWVGLEGYHKLLSETRQYGLTYEFYRDQVELAYIAQQMRENGINVNRELAESLDKATFEEKELLFNPPGDIEIPFNPQSSQEVLAYFGENRIKLKDTTKPHVQDVIKKLAAKRGLDYDEFVLCEDLSEPEQWLVKLGLYKGLGKGFKGWFAEKYFGKDGLLHPRFYTTGTQTGRWACSYPNVMNMPAHRD